MELKDCFVGQKVKYEHPSGLGPGPIVKRGTVLSVTTGNTIRPIQVEWDDGIVGYVHYTKMQYLNPDCDIQVATIDLTVDEFLKQLEPYARK